MKKVICIISTVLIIIFVNMLSYISACADEIDWNAYEEESIEEYEETELYPDVLQDTEDENNMENFENQEDDGSEEELESVTTDNQGTQDNFFVQSADNEKATDSETNNQTVSSEETERPQKKDEKKTSSVIKVISAFIFGFFVGVISLILALFISGKRIYNSKEIREIKRKVETVKNKVEQLGNHEEGDVDSSVVE